MVPLPPAKPPESNALGTIAKLSLSQNQIDLCNDTHTQTISNNPIIPNNVINSTPTTNIAQPNDQSTIILQQFSMITEELKNFTNKASGDITKITQAYNTSYEKTGKLIEKAISQALTKAQSIIISATLIDTRFFGTNYTNLLMKQVRHQLGLHTTIICHNSQTSIHIKFTDLTKIIYLNKLIQTNNTPIKLP